MKNERILMPYIKGFYDMIIHDNTIKDKSGMQIAEIMGVSALLHANQKVLDFYGVRKTNEKYTQKELEWYDSQELSIDKVSDVKIWRDVASKDGLINSNYGWCIYSEDNYSQYKNVIKELSQNQNSRRATMIYTRPSMWEDYNYHGMSDFICTNYHHFFIRDNSLISIYNMRSQDFIFGLFNDFWWACTVQERVLKDLQEFYPNLTSKYILWQASSLHVYERHFDTIIKIIDTHDEIEKQKKLIAQSV